MAESLSAGSAHLARLHHHRKRVQQARAAIAAGAEATVATHYDHSRAAGPSAPSRSPDRDGDSEVSPPDHNPPTDPPGADKEAPDVRPG